jgi:hypothetical protein
MIDPLATILSQYSGSARTVALIEYFNTWIDPSADLDAFFAMIWDLDSAQGVGLDIWGRIVGVGRVLQVASGTFFGFAETLDTITTSTFGSGGPFFSGGATTTNFALSNDGFRTLIFAKALSNITDGSIPVLNAILRILFPDRGNCYVVDNADMTMVYKFEFPLTPVEAAIVENSGVLPRPLGVSATVVTV